MAQDGRKEGWEDMKEQETGKNRETRIAVIGIIIEDRSQAEQVNGLLHQYGSFVIGRMGLPYEKKQVNIISVVLDAPMDVISALSGKLGRLPGVSTKALYSRAEKKKTDAPGQGEETDIDFPVDL